MLLEKWNMLNDIDSTTQVNETRTIIIDPLKLTPLQENVINEIKKERIILKENNFTQY
ncbi:MAG: hypothetical protein HeimC3_29700 [Candidatus Heimdallarchaeota archaeon LC_3]|nr:MAG: hypothetical protein HeimC3_29700 [Candidatus Heimdallarchaeota archaeon LC_3]